MRKAHVDPFLISSATLPALSHYEMCGQVKGAAVLIHAVSSVVLLHITNKQCIHVATHLELP